MGFHFKTAVAALAMAATTTAVSAQDITMNVGFGAPEDSLYGRSGAIFEELAEEYTGGSVDVTGNDDNDFVVDTEDGTGDSGAGGEAVELGPYRGQHVAAARRVRVTDSGVAWLWVCSSCASSGASAASSNGFPSGRRADPSAPVAALVKASK